MKLKAPLHFHGYFDKVGCEEYHPPDHGERARFLHVIRDRLATALCRHEGGIHLCQPPNGIPSLVICRKCWRVLRDSSEQDA